MLRRKFQYFILLVTLHTRKLHYRLAIIIFIDTCNIIFIRGMISYFQNKMFMSDFASLLKDLHLEYFLHFQL